MALRFSIKTLLAAFTVVAVCCAGLTFANNAWANFFYTAALTMVLVGVVAAVVRRGPTRAFWIGFAVFATGHFVMADREERYLVLPGQYNINREPSLATTQLMLAARDWVASLTTPARPRNPRAIYAPQGPGIVQVGGQATFYPDRPGNFVLIGNSIFTLSTLR